MRSSECLDKFDTSNSHPILIHFKSILFEELVSFLNKICIPRFFLSFLFSFFRIYKSPSISTYDTYTNHLFRSFKMKQSVSYALVLGLAASGGHGAPTHAADKRTAACIPGPGETCGPLGLPVPEYNPPVKQRSQICMPGPGEKCGIAGSPVPDTPMFPGKEKKKRQSEPVKVPWDVEAYLEFMEGNDKRQMGRPLHVIEWQPSDSLEYVNNVRRQSPPDRDEFDPSDELEWAFGDKKTKRQFVPNPADREDYDLSNSDELDWALGGGD